MAVGLLVFLLFAFLFRKTIKILLVLFILFAVFALAKTGHAEDMLYYGSRAGMQYTVVSSSGIGTAEAEIKTRHTRDNALAYCRDYVQSVTKGCIAENLGEVPPKVTLTGNCETGDFTGFDGEEYRFDGTNDPTAGEDAADMMAEYRIVHVSDQAVLDGSSASGYDVALGVYQALCPGASDGTAN